MRAPAAPALREYLGAERAYYDAQTGRLAPLTDVLFAESVGRTATMADSVAWTVRGFRYWYRTPAGAEARQLLRAPARQIRDAGGASEADGPAEQILLDENELSAATGFVDIGIREVSPDNRLLAWSADTSGAEIYRLRFTDLQAGRLLPDLIKRSYPGGAWASDCEHFFYLVPDELNRPHQVWRHRVGSRPGEDVLVYSETDARYELTLRAARSGALDPHHRSLSRYHRGLDDPGRPAAHGTGAGGAAPPRRRVPGRPCGRPQRRRGRLANRHR